jgi:hypothetical protein
MMLGYQQSLHSVRQLMTGIDVPDQTNPDYSIPDSIAALAVANGIGFGSQGLQETDITSYNAGRPCGVDWCNLFNLYAGRVPLELQTLFASDPTGAGVGSLTDLLPFGVQRHARNFEIYYSDWLIAFDPNYPQYAQYHGAYQQALQNAAGAPGGDHSIHIATKW